MDVICPLHKRQGNPVNILPFESREGGYQWIYGGPYDTRDELWEQFEDLVPEAVINALVDELNVESVDWSPRDLENGLAWAVTSNTKFGSTLNEALDIIDDLLEVTLDDRLAQQLLRLLHVHAITALETFLSDAFINTALKDDASLRKFVEGNPDFEKLNLSLSQIFKRRVMLRDEVRE